MSKEFHTYSPETVIFLGAGATAPLMPPTSGISKFITSLIGKKTDLETRINDSCYKFLPLHKTALESLLIMLGDKGEIHRDEEIDKKAKEYAIKYNCDYVETSRQLKKLSNLYNWDCFKTIAQLSEIDENNQISIMTLYTQLDILINTNAGFKCYDKFYYPHEIIAARNCIILLSNLLLYSTTKYNLDNCSDLKNKYETFFSILAKLMLKEGIDRENFNYESLEFIIFSYAIISFNWDPVLLGMLFNAHKEINHSNLIPYLGNRCQKLRLFNDFGIVIGSLRIDKGKIEPGIWYQGHESIAKRLNDNEYPNRLMRVGKYLFPHGSSAFRICPVCKKTNFVVRNLGVDYLNYYGPGILPEFGNFFSDDLLTEDESIAFKEGKFDAIQCYKCGNITRSIDTPMIFQTAVKKTKPPLLEEAVNEMLVLVKKAKHLIFNGYSLPPDDVLYRSMIVNAVAEKEEKLKITVVLFDKSVQSGKWFSKKETEELIKSNTLNPYESKIAQGFINLFNNNDLRFSFKGFPYVLGDITIESVSDFLYFGDKY